VSYEEAKKSFTALFEGHIGDFFDALLEGSGKGICSFDAVFGYENIYRKKLVFKSARILNLHV